ncbi:hypothetical protein [Streptococcus sp. X13SY08]|nr:hypothetical protein [Streptococcus sp. X13SY08]
MGFNPLIGFLVKDELLAKSLMVNNILLYLPLIYFLVFLTYTYRHRYSLPLAIWGIIVFCTSILSFGEMILLYGLIYNLAGQLGAGIGFLLNLWIKKKKST